MGRIFRQLVVFCILTLSFVLFGADKVYKARTGSTDFSNYSEIVKLRDERFVDLTGEFLTEETVAHVHHRSCERQALFHNHTAEEMSVLYNRSGVVPWVLVDSFVTRSGNPCSWKYTCKEKLPVISIVLMARVYKAPPFNLTQRLAKPRRRKEYAALASNKSVEWKCMFESEKTSTNVLETVGDGDMHTLILRCPLPSVSLNRGTNTVGRLHTSVSLIAVTQGETLLSYSGIHPCDRELVPKKIKMGACVMFQEMSPLNTANTAAIWTRFMLKSGFDFVALYLDPMLDAKELEKAVNGALAPEIGLGLVTTVLFHMNGRYSLQTQSAQQNHCQWRFRGRAQWIAQLDLDEFVEPLGQFSRVKDVLNQYDNNTKVAALQLRNRFWDHHPTLQSNFSHTSNQAWNMVWRDNRPTVTGREKIISKSELVDYISVHKVTTGGRMHVPDPDNEMRHNHFSRHFKGFDEGVDCGSSFRAGNCKNALMDPIKDLSFQQYYRRINQ